MASALARFPFVSKEEILRAYRPGAAGSDRTFRTLRGHGWVSPGIEIRRRRQGRVVGQLRCYAALNIDAVVLARHDQVDAAVRLAEQASRFEEEWRTTVAELTDELDVADFEAFRRLRNQFVHGLAPAAEQLEALHGRVERLVGQQVREQFVRIGEVTGDWTKLQVLISETEVWRSLWSSSDRAHRTLDATGEDGDPTRPRFEWLAVDSFLPTAAGLHAGDLAVLRIEQSAGSSLLSLLAAIGDAGEESFNLDEDVAKYFSEEPLPASVLQLVEARRAIGDGIEIPMLILPVAS